MQDDGNDYFSVSDTGIVGSWKIMEVICKRNKIFVHTTKQSANHARALQVDSELLGRPSINY